MKKINQIILDLLERRGITENEDVLEFLSGKPQKTYDPFLLLNLEAGVDFVLSAVAEGKKICIYGDYDADGITSICILMDILKSLTDNLIYYIPSRFDEGYGLNKEAIKTIKDGGTELLITVDCGSVSYDEVEYAKEIGLDVIVTDHHSITDCKADCILINPKQEECTYPFQDLAGCGVAFKLAQGIQKKAKLPKQVLNNVLDLVAVGTIGDIVPLIDENRTLVKYGLHFVNRGIRPGLQGLIEGISLKSGKINSDQVAFGIVPHINAAGRIEDAQIASQLLLSHENHKIQKNISKLITCNQQRKQIQQEAFTLCVDKIESETEESLFLILDTGDQVHEGIAGIVAGKLKDKYNKPTVLLTLSEDQCYKGTGRSIPGIDLYQTLKHHENLFARFGGHEGACGFLMKKEHLATLRNGLESDINQLVQQNPDLFVVRPTVDLTIANKDVTLQMAEDLELLGPFGSKNPKPSFLLSQVYVDKQYPMGSDKTHIRFHASGQDGWEVQCVLFNRAKDYQGQLYGKEPVDLIGSIDIQEWKGTRKVQFNVEAVI